MKPPGLNSLRSAKAHELGTVILSAVASSLSLLSLAQTPPANDSFANSIACTGSVVTLAGSNVGATKEPGEVSVASNYGGKSVWWSWTAPSNGVFIVDTQGSSFDTLLSVREGATVEGLATVASSDDYSGLYWSRVNFTATSGQVYHLCVDGHNPAVDPNPSPKLDGTNALSAANGTIVLNLQPGPLPSISYHPRGMTNTTGSLLNLWVTASGATKYQWLKDGAMLPGATKYNYVVTSAQPADTGIYSVALSNSAGLFVMSSSANVVIGDVVITQHPLSRHTGAGYNTTFSVLAAGISPVSYQWQKNGEFIPGATSTNLTINTVQADDAGTYNVWAMTANASVLSSNAVLAVMNYTFGTLAGAPGLSGGKDGKGTEARFNGPTGIAVDQAGMLYVTEWLNHTIRKITPAGEVTTIAGLAGSQGTNDGVGAIARFKNPEGVVVDTKTNLYIADNFNHTIRKMVLDETGTNWMVSTMAGIPGTYGWRDGPGNQALFLQPCGLALDRLGNLYVTEWNNNSVRMIRPHGYVSTFAAGKAGLDTPNNVVFDAEGNIFVTCERLGKVVRITPGSVATTVATGPAYSCYGGFLDGEGNFYVAGATGLSGLNSIRKFFWTGEWGTIAGGTTAGFGDGPGYSALFNSRRNRMVIDDKGTMYVTDDRNNVIRRGVPFGVMAGPLSQGVTVGTAVTLGAHGPDGFTYQWAFQEDNLAGQTGTELSLGPVLRTNSGPYSVTLRSPDGAWVRLVAMVRALVPPIMMPPEVLTDGSLRLRFQDSDGGLPYDLNQAKIYWRTNLAGGETNWQLLNAAISITNGIAEATHSQATTIPARYYRIEER